MEFSFVQLNLIDQKNSSWSLSSLSINGRQKESGYTL